MSSSTKKILFNFLSIALVAAVFYYLGNEIYKNWNLIANYEFHFNYPLLFAASGVYSICLLLLAIGWWVLLKNLHAPISLKDALVYFFITQPCKYVPGKIWVPVARSKLCKKYSVSTSVCFLSTGIEGLMEMLAGTYISLFAIIASSDFGAGAKTSCYILAALGLLLLIPRVFYFCINLFLRLTKQPQICKEGRVGFKKLFGIQVLYGVGMFLMGAAQVLFLMALTPIDLKFIPFLVSVGTFSFVAGAIAFFSPSGLGVREGVWYAALGGIVPEYVGLIFSLISRLWMVLVEAILAFISLGVFFLMRNGNGNETTITVEPRN